MRCQSKEWIIKDKQKFSCDEKATKKCKHEFATCNRHFHGCKNEEKFPIDNSTKT